MSVGAPLQGHIAIAVPGKRGWIALFINGADVVLAIAINGDNSLAVRRQQQSDEPVRRHRSRLAAVHILDVRPQHIASFAAGEKDAASIGRPGGPIKVFHDRTARHRPGVSRTCRQQHELLWRLLLQRQRPASIGRDAPRRRYPSCE